MAGSEAELRQRWSEGRPCHGLWSLLPGAVTGEVLARTGADYVVVDLQHGATAEADLPGTCAAITAAGSVPLVRTRSPLFPDLGRPLDLGARGVIVPNVRDAGHAREVVAACRYAPAGGRSIGRLSGGADEPLVLVMVEAASMLADLDAVLEVPGLDGLYVGPADLALSLELTGEGGREELRAVLSSIIARARAAGVPVGVHARSGEEAAGFAAEGATVVTAAVDAGSLAEATAHHLGIARGAATG
ncbi:HpcH/HpaI aldolase family protein [Blastococcus sp. SYSU DS0533]